MWTVSGMFHKFQFISDFVAYLKEYHDLTLPLESLHDSPDVSWNAGRCSNAELAASQACQIIDYVNSVGIGVVLTFSNHLLEKHHIQDPSANELLDKIASRPDINGVLIASDLLSGYITGKYPKLRQIVSVVKIATERGKGNTDYYRSLQNRYEGLVVHPDDNRNIDLLKTLNPDKVEILVNEECIFNCPVRKEHYDCISKCTAANYSNMTRSSGMNSLMWYQTESQLEKLNNEHEQFVIERCPSYNIHKSHLTCNLTHVEMKNLYDLGFRHFKLQGRKDELVKYLYNIVHYLLEPASVAPFVFKTLATKLYSDSADRRIFPGHRWAGSDEGLRESA